MCSGTASCYCRHHIIYTYIKALHILSKQRAMQQDCEEQTVADHLHHGQAIYMAQQGARKAHSMPMHTCSRCTGQAHNGHMYIVSAWWGSGPFSGRRQEPLQLTAKAGASCWLLSCSSTRCCIACTILCTEKAGLVNRAELPVTTLTSKVYRAPYAIGNHKPDT